MDTPLDREHFGELYESTQCPADDCRGEYAGTDICPYGCTRYTGGESDG
jgi:hypothetical protein